MASHIFDLETLNAIPGTYALILRLSKKTQTIEIGRLGQFVFAAGFYVYVGSAFGPGGLRARLNRHLNAHKPLHWHIDYLRAHAEIIEIWISTDPQKYECQWAAKLCELKATTIPVIGMGSSDCCCKSHVIYFPSKPSFSAFKKQAGTLLCRITPK